jgi:hypothetical protein
MPKMNTTQIKLDKSGRAWSYIQLSVGKLEKFETDISRSALEGSRSREYDTRGFVVLALTGNRFGQELSLVTTGWQMERRDKETLCFVVAGQIIS